MTDPTDMELATGHKNNTTMENSQSNNFNNSLRSDQLDESFFSNERSLQSYNNILATMSASANPSDLGNVDMSESYLSDDDLEESTNTEDHGGVLFEPERSHRSHHTSVTTATRGTDSVVTTSRPSTASAKTSVISNLSQSAAAARRSSKEMSVIDDSYRSNAVEDLETNMYNQVAAIRREEACERKSQLCFGSCCDLVKGAIIANILNVILVIVHLVLSDPRVDLIPALDSFGPPKLGIVFTGLSVPFSLFGIYGAYKFHKWFVLATAIWYVVYAAIGGIHRIVISSLTSLLFAYPHFHLFVSLRNGAITPDNYKKTERYCCCALRGMDFDEDASDCCS